MAELSSAHGAFADSMERLDQIVRSVKLQQIAEQQGPVQAASNRMNAISPDEAWARQFSNQCIGPVCFGPAPKIEMPMPLANVMQSFSAERASAYAPASASKSEVPALSVTRNDAPMGASIGRARGKRSFGRWLLGRK
jgi:hypothetical protein